jgi:hypothetical protein
MNTSVGTTMFGPLNGRNSYYQTESSVMKLSAWAMERQENERVTLIFLCLKKATIFEATQRQRSIHEKNNSFLCVGRLKMNSEPIRSCKLNHQRRRGEGEKNCQLAPPSAISSACARRGWPSAVLWPV